WQHGHHPTQRVQVLWIPHCNAFNVQLYYLFYNDQKLPKDCCQVAAKNLYMRSPGERGIGRNNRVAFLRKSKLFCKNNSSIRQK
ncbi:Hypothetical predicted protein, partial [Paramuricea clavata]